MKKHAYLIMAHTQFELLECLLKSLDHERNDIYVHIDKKAGSIDFSMYQKLLKKANLKFTERIDVCWGTFSQIQCEMILLKEAAKQEHAYYHLLSGMDLPIKSQQEIFDFFDAHQGLEFIDEDQQEISEASLSRIRYYHHFFGKKGSERDYLGALEVKIQKLMRVDRLKKAVKISYQKGRNWFSITHGMAQCILEKESWIMKTFQHSICGDELFVQTIARNSQYASRICNPHTMPQIPDTRLIDWDRGSHNNPYIFREKDWKELQTSSALFARKFDLQVDRRIVEILGEKLIRSGQDEL